jgi:uncharacterized membrane protein YfcA
MPTFGLLFCIVLGAFFTEAVAGFGATVLTVAFGATLLPLETLLPSFVPVNLMLSLAIVTRHHDAIDRRLLLRHIVPWMLVGLPVGLFMFRRMAGEHERALKLAFGCVVIGLATLELVRMARARTPRPLPRPAAAGLLALGGAIHGAWSSGGPMVVYVVGRNDLDKRRFRSTLATLWLTMGTLLFAGYLQSGAANAQTARISLGLLPAMLGGLVLGERAHTRIPQHRFRLAVAVVLLGAGVNLALHNLR